MRKQVLSILVNNMSGTLSRIAGLFSRRGYNIDSITAGTTANPNYSRLTVVATGEELIIEQIEKQLSKLEDVIDIRILSPEASVCRELIMIKVAATAEQRHAVIGVADIFRAKIVDVEPECMIIELTGTKDKVEAFIQLLKDYEILELARTGITALSRGTDGIYLP